jgi:hypothetical protein
MKQMFNVLVNEHNMRMHKKAVTEYGISRSWHSGFVPVYWKF